MEKRNLKYEYPELSEYGQQKTQQIVNKFKTQLEEILNDTLYSFTCNIGSEITNDDSWIDLRRQVINALCDYPDHDREAKQAGTYLGQWWVQIRKKILEENREAIYNDILKDKDYEIQQLKDEIQRLKDLQRGY